MQDVEIKELEETLLTFLLSNDCPAPGSTFFVTSAKLASAAIFSEEEKERLLLAFNKYHKRHRKTLSLGRHGNYSMLGDLATDSAKNLGLKVRFAPWQTWVDVWMNVVDFNADQARGCSVVHREGTMRVFFDAQKERHIEMVKTLVNNNPEFLVLVCKGEIDPDLAKMIRQAGAVLIVDNGRCIDLLQKKFALPALITRTFTGWSIAYAGAKPADKRSAALEQFIYSPMDISSADWLGWLVAWAATDPAELTK